MLREDGIRMALSQRPVIRFSLLTREWIYKKVCRKEKRETERIRSQQRDVASKSTFGEGCLDQALAPVLPVSIGYFL